MNALLDNAAAMTALGPMEWEAEGLMFRFHRRTPNTVWFYEWRHPDELDRWHTACGADETVVADRACMAAIEVLRKSGHFLIDLTGEVAILEPLWNSCHKCIGSGPDLASALAAALTREGA